MSEFPRRLQPVTHDEARAILSRFNASHWGNIGQEKARYSIPCDPTRDDDCLMDQYIREQRALDAELAQLREAVRVAKLDRDRFEKSWSPPFGFVRLPDGRDVKISQAGMHVLTSIADGNPLGAYVTAGILDWHPPTDPTAKAAIDAARKEPQ